MRRLSALSALFALAVLLAACSGSSSSLQRNDRFSGMTFSIPIGSSFK